MDVTGEITEHLATLREAIAELSNCIAVGPDWFTKGEWGQKAHGRTWTDKAMTALAELEKQITSTKASS